MFDTKSVSIDWAGRPLTLETGRVARQADGAVFATWGETALLATVVYAKEAKPGQDFFPLTVNYQEKYFASGRIPGGFFKREGRPTERETLLSRLIDRPIRPLFVDGFKNEVQVIITVLSWDNENESDLLAMVAASAALTISGVPFMGPIAASRVGWIDGKPLLNPTIEQMKTSELDLVVAGTANAIMMVESEVKELSEAQMLEALALAHKGMQPVIDAIIELAEKAGKEPFEFDPPDQFGAARPRSRISSARISATAYKMTKKDERYAAVGALREKAKAALVKTEANPDGARRQRVQGSLQGSRKRRRPHPHRQGKGPHRRPRRRQGAPDRVAWSASCRARTARRCSPAVKRNRSSSPRSAPAKTSNSSTRSQARPKSASCSTTTSLPTASVKPAAWAAPAAAKSATASWRGAR